ncbi:MAG: chorismate mutase [Bacteroidales bacterium]|nr:MAG: chorismate mutase [Bacteroidales bacterium]
MKLPEKCENIMEIREAIDTIDKEIIELIGRRFNYVKEIVKFKEKDKDSIIAKDRYNQVIENRRILAVKNGLNPDLIENIYKSLINHFIDKEIEIVENLKLRK